MLKEQMVDTERLNEAKTRLEEIRKLVVLTDDELKAKMFADLEEVFSDPDSLKEMREGYEVTIKQIEGVIQFIEGLSKMSEGFEGAKSFGDLDTLVRILKSSPEE